MPLSLLMVKQEVVKHSQWKVTNTIKTKNQ